MQRPAGGAGAVAAASAGKTMGYKVSSQSKNDEIGLQTLIGDYEEKGTNHGKKYYQKVQKISGHENVKVFLYYWDGRDGADFSGWWFGDQVGGSQVWAKSPSHGATPPKTGWKVPWDAPTAVAGILLVEPTALGGGTAGAAAPSVAARAAPTGAAAGGAAGAVTASLQGRVAEAEAKVKAIEAAAQEVIGNAKAMTATSDVGSITECQEALAAQQKELVEVQKSLTQDITEARKGGAPATAFMTQLSKLSPRLRVLQTSLTAEVSKIRGLSAKATAGAATAKKLADSAAANKAAEEKDSKEFEDALPGIKEIVGSAEEAVEGIVVMAAPLIADPPDDDGEILNRATEEVETAATEAQSKITEARSSINTKLQAARKFAPETRKKALAEFSSLQQKLTEAQKKLNPYKAFKKEFKARVQARKQLQELTDKLSAQELEVEKVKMMSSAAEAGQMSEEEISSAEKLIQPAKAAIENLLRTIDQKLRQAEGALKEELSGAKDKNIALKKDLDGVIAVLTKQRQSAAMAETLRAASEKVDKAEASLAKCQEAEMPFLKGIEVLPGEESTKALTECEKAASAAAAAVSQANSWLKSKLAEAKKMVKELSTNVTEELTAHQSRLETVSKKVADFRKETSERKTAALLAEVLEAMSTCEKKMGALSKVAEVFSNDNLESVTTEELKEGIAKSSELETEVSHALLEVRRIFAQKQKEAKSSEAIQGLQKLQTRINTAQSELAASKKAAGMGEKLIKGKEVLAEEEVKVSKMEEDIKNAEKKVKPGEEEAALGIEEAKVSDEEIEVIAKLFGEGLTTLKASTRTLDGNAAQAPPSLKTLLHKLAERAKATVSKINELMALTKDQRERVMSQAFLREGKEKVDAIDQALEKVNDAELPFLKGLEVLALEETKSTLAASDEAAAAVHSAVAAARTFIASKNLEIKKFGEATSKPAIEELLQLTERVNAGSAKLGQFKKDTEQRRKAALIQEAGEKVNTALEAVKKLVEIGEPFLGENGASGEHSEEDCLKLVEVMKESSALLTEAGSFALARNKDAAGNQTQLNNIKELQGKLRQGQSDVSKYKKVASTYEAKYAAKKVIADADEHLENIEKELTTLTEAVAPLVEEGAQKFLVDVCIDLVASVLRDQMKSKDSSMEDLYRDFSGGAGTLNKDTFCSYLEKLPAELSREELEFEADRRVAIFEALDTDKDGNLSLPEFKAIFLQKFHCVKEITLTDGFDVSKSKTVAKVPAGTELETSSGSQKDESNGLTRIECTAVGLDKTGWVTLSGNQGTRFVEPITSFSVFVKEMEPQVETVHKSIGQAANWFATKAKELQSAPKDSPLATARTDLQKLRGKVSVTQDGLSKLRGKFQLAKRDFPKKEAAVRNAHVLRKEQKEADAISGPAKEKLAALEEAMAAMTEAAKTMQTLSAEEVLSFASPLTTLEACENQFKVVSKLLEEMKTVTKEQQEKVPAGKRTTAMTEALRSLQAGLRKCELVKKNSTGALDAVKKQCATIADAKAPEVRALFRKEAQTKSLEAEAYFLQLSGGSDKISEETFCKLVADLAGGDAPVPEQVKLLCRHMQAGGWGRRTFQAFVQQYFKVVKGIAITDCLDIASAQAKTLRKAEVDEVIELLEGPETDAKVGITRIRGRSLMDSVTGWITLKGNQGTPFLQEVEKPFYACQVETPLEKEIKSESGDNVVRALKPEEVLELVEGPRKTTFEPGLKVKGKAVSDGAIGWFCVRDKTGTVFAEADNKYYSCTSSIAMTDNFDIKDCKVVRKLAAGELFMVEEGPVQVEDAGISRVKGKSLKDEAVGWVTIKGNAGTVYAEASNKHFCILQDVPLTKRFPTLSAGEEVRVLAKGEAMQVLEGPKEENFQPETRLKVKALSDGALGWITKNKATVKPWTPYYKCTTATPVHDAAAAEGATVLRQVEVGETFELLEGPMQDGEAIRIKGKAEKDGVAGFVTLRDSEGKKHFEPLPPASGN